MTAVGKSSNFCEDGMSARGVTKKKAKKSGGRRTTKAAAKAHVNVGEVRERVLQVIAEKAEAMTSANVEEATKGHVTQLKYLFEVLGIYPVTASAELEAQDSNDLARVLLNRFDFPYQ